MSISCINDANRKINAGTLYLDIAPNTGVLKPITIKYANEKLSPNKNIFGLSIFLFGNIIIRIISRKKIRFSIELANI